MPKTLSSSTEALAERAAEEIERLHEFFDDWFSGTNDRNLTEMSGCLDELFYLVSPDGQVHSKSSIVKAVESNNNTGSVGIDVRNVSFKGNIRGVFLLVYEEHQARSDGPAARVSTVGMVTDETTPGGFRWLFVHETELAP